MTQREFEVWLKRAADFIEGQQKVAVLSRTEIEIPPENTTIKDTRIDIPPIYLTNTNTRLYIKSPVAKIPPESIIIEDILHSSFVNPSTRLYIKDTSDITFLKELEILINRYSLENGSDTPDYILARYLNASLTAWNVACNEREKWYFDKQEKQNDKIN